MAGPFAALTNNKKQNMYKDISPSFKLHNFDPEVKLSDLGSQELTVGLMKFSLPK
jgi:hypothetical protein